MKRLSINISGTGTREEIISYLNDCANSIGYLTDAEVDEGGCSEDGELSWEYQGVVDSPSDGTFDPKEQNGGGEGKIVPFESPTLKSLKQQVIEKTKSF